MSIYLERTAIGPSIVLLFRPKIHCSLDFAQFLLITNKIILTQILVHIGTGFSKEFVYKENSKIALF